MSCSISIILLLVAFFYIGLRELGRSKQYHTHLPVRDGPLKLTSKWFVHLVEVADSLVLLLLSLLEKHFTCMSSTFRSGGLCSASENASEVSIQARRQNEKVTGQINMRAPEICYFTFSIPHPPHPPSFSSNLFSSAFSSNLGSNVKGKIWDGDVW